MKSALEAYKERYASVNPAGFSAYEKGFEAGAEEMRKSLRCETCKHWMRFFSLTSRGNCNGWLERVTNDTNGCIYHEQKEAKR